MPGGRQNHDPRHDVQSVGAERVGDVRSHKKATSHVVVFPVFLELSK